MPNAIIDYHAKEKAIDGSPCFTYYGIKELLPVEIKSDLTIKDSQFKQFTEFEKIISCCITMYNEEADSFKNTMNSLIESIRYYQKNKGSSTETDNTKFQICIILDGTDSISVSMKSFLSQLYIYEPAHLEPNAELHVFRSVIRNRGSEPFDHINNNTFLDSDMMEELTDIEFLLCIVPQNHGKLNSHKWYFLFFSHIYNPKYCIQIDAGVCPAKPAIFHLIENLDLNPETAALAARSMVDNPKNMFDMNKCWQYYNFVSERLIFWPIEVFLGYLSVLPGQIHALRWKALINRENFIDEKDYSPKKPFVLAEYFKDLNNLGILEANMYLAEDRIMGINLVFNEEKSWNVDYEIDAEATTDACDSWNELLKQRRRWICGALACKLPMLKKARLSARNLPLRQKIKRHFSLAYFVIVMMLEWITPVFSIGMHACFYAECARVIRGSVLLNSAVYYLFALSLLCFLIQFIIAIIGTLNRLTNMFYKFSTVYQTSFLCLMFFLLCRHYILLSIPYVPLILYTFSFVFLITAILVRSKKHFVNIAKILPAFAFSNYYISYLTHIYAIYNMSDTSWGTKGLSKPVNQGTDKGINNAGRLRFKIILISIHIIINAGVFLVLRYAFLSSFYFYFVSVLQLVVSVFSVGISVYGKKRLQFNILINHFKD